MIRTRALISCCADTLAQHFGRNCCFAQQAPEGVLRAAQHAFLAAQLFSPQAKKMLSGSFSPVEAPFLGSLQAKTMVQGLRSYTYGPFFKALNYLDVFQGESSFYLFLEGDFSVSDKSHLNVRKCKDCFHLDTITKTVLYVRTKWYG